MPEKASRSSGTLIISHYQALALMAALQFVPYPGSRLTRIQRANVDPHDGLAIHLPAARIGVIALPGQSLAKALGVLDTGKTRLLYHPAAGRHGAGGRRRSGRDRLSRC